MTLVYIPRIIVKTPGVMRGLDPRIHPFAKKLDCRVKPSNDEREVAPYSAGLTSVLPAAFAAASAFVLAALPSTIFTDQIEPS